MKHLLYFCLVLSFVSCSKDDDGMKCEGTITEGTRFIWFDLNKNPENSTFYYPIDTLIIANDTVVNGVVYKNKHDTGDRYVFTLNNLDFRFKNGQAFDNLSVCFVEYNEKDNVEYIISDGFMVAYERADLQKKTDNEYLFKMVGQNIDSLKIASGSSPNAGIVFMDTEMLFYIKD